MRELLAAGALAALLAAPAVAAPRSELARCHARQVEAVATLGRAQLASFSAHVKRRHRPDSWFGCAEPALNGEHVFAGVSVVTTPAPGVFEGSYEAVSGTFREPGLLLEGVGTLAAGEFESFYNDFYDGAFFSAGAGLCTSESDPDDPSVYRVRCDATDSLGLACASKEILATVRR